MLRFYEVKIVLYDLQMELLWLLMVEVFIEKIRQFFDEVEIFMLEQIMFFQLVEAQIFLISEYSHMVIQNYQKTQ